MNRLPLLVALAVLVSLAMVSVAAAQEDGEVVLTVGNPGKLDSPNVTVGYTIEAYELWNLHYATLTDKAAADFATTPGLAESWEGSEDGRTWTYTLREGLEWSDGTPLTAEDVAYTVNRSRDEEWINHSATTQNLEATAPDPRTVVITSSVPDPKLPTMDVYILPKHVYEEISADEITKYPGLDFVGSGPFVLSEVKSGQFWRMTANDAFWGGRPEVDEVVFRTFNNADAMVAALRRSEIDIAQDVPEEAFLALGGEDGIETVEGRQGGFDELALNGGDGFGKPHPALLDIEFRKAIAHAIDRDTIVERVYAGIGEVATTISPSADPKWVPELTEEEEEEEFEFDLEKAKGILDAAGYEDLNGNGIREHEGQDIVLRYALRTESQVSEPIYEFVSGWLEEIGIDTSTKAYDDSQLGEVVGKGEYDMFTWGWTPFVDPDPMLSYFTCDQVSTDPENPTDYYNDASWCNEEYDRLYEEQNVELDPDRRLELVHEMIKLFYADAVYFPLQYGGDLQAYRTDRFDGWVQQPADTGPVIFSNTSPSYAALTPLAGGGDDGGMSTAALVALALGGAAVLGIAIVTLRQRRTREERE